MQETKSRAERLIRRAHIMTLATARGEIPWAAAVYYMAHKGELYFFSSPEARHIVDGEGKRVAATIHETPFHVGEIEGLQMDGTITRAGLSSDAMAAFARYVKRFDFLTELFAPKSLESLSRFLAAGKPKWYRFTPKTLLYLDNEQGFGHRIALDAEDLYSPDRGDGVF